MPDISVVRTHQLSSPHIMTRLESDRHPFAPKSQKANTRIIHRDRSGGVHDAIGRLSCAQPPMAILLQLAAAVVSFATATVVSNFSTEGGGVHEKPPKKGFGLKGECHWGAACKCMRSAAAFSVTPARLCTKNIFWS
jgi:hypothetical protein